MALTRFVFETLTTYFFQLQGRFSYLHAATLNGGLDQTSSVAFPISVPFLNLGHGTDRQTDGNQLCLMPPLW